MTTSRRLLPSLELVRYHFIELVETIVLLHRRRGLFQPLHSLTLVPLSFRSTADVLFVGPFDLAKSMDIKFGGDEHEAAIARVLKAAKANGKTASIFCKSLLKPRLPPPSAPVANRHSRYQA